MKKVAIQDANILIDLVKTGLFNHCFALDYQFITTDMILDELYAEQIASIQPSIDSGKFTVIEISEDELIEIQLMSLEDQVLSEQDWSAIYYALLKKALLLSGDRRLKIRAETKGLNVCGILWLIDQMVDSSILLKEEACSFLQSLMLHNKRLPVTECEKRIELWCGIK